MKNLLICALALAATPAIAKPSALELPRSSNSIALARASAEFNIGPAGATLERNYFHAPATDSHSRLNLCPFEPSMFVKIRLTQSCR